MGKRNRCDVSKAKSKASKINVYGCQVSRLTAPERGKTETNPKRSSLTGRRRLLHRMYHFHYATKSSSQECSKISLPCNTEIKTNQPFHLFGYVPFPHSTKKGTPKRGTRKSYIPTKKGTPPLLTNNATPLLFLKDVYCLLYESISRGKKYCPQQSESLDACTNRNGRKTYVPRRCR